MRQLHGKMLETTV